MDFGTWFEGWKEDGETDTKALQRLSAITDVSYKTLFYVRKGARTDAETVRTLVEFSGGEVDAWSLLSGPHRDELKGTTESTDADAAE